jgi:hypothetical protein
MQRLRNFDARKKCHLKKFLLLTQQHFYFVNLRMTDFSLFPCSILCLSVLIDTVKALVAFSIIMIGLNVILVLGTIFLVVGQSNFDDQISISQPTSTPTWISDPTQDPNLPFMSIPRPAGPIQNMNAPIEPDQVTMDPRISQNTVNLQSSSLSPNEQTAGGGPKITSLNYGGPFQSPGLPGTSFGYPGPSQYPGQYSGGAYGLSGQYGGGGYGLPGQYAAGGYVIPGQYSGGGYGLPGQYAGVGYAGQYSGGGYGLTGQYLGGGYGLPGQYAGVGYAGQYSGGGYGLPGQYLGGGYGLPGQYGGGGYGLPGQYSGGGYGLPGQYSGGSCGTPRVEIPIPCPRIEIPIVQCPVYQYQCPSPYQRF